MSTFKNNQRGWVVLLLLTAIVNLSIPLTPSASATGPRAMRRTSQPVETETAASDTLTS